jgi:hypothetical protein
VNVVEVILEENCLNAFESSVTTRPNAKWHVLGDANLLLLLGGPGELSRYSDFFLLDGAGIKYRWTARFSAYTHTGPGSHPTSCKMGTGFLSRRHSGRGVALNTHPDIKPKLKKE